ncbi:DUF922 domain-containing protein [Sphingomonas mesophila]|uniref:DUF922 domain-containing protein n=1 Tax=Sphingomonas mesophila TaxID=2303576 RepID=UPI0013C2B37A|nr:DUF922 domain-containing protein [Sphingomonas mesophila]
MLTIGLLMLAAAPDAPAATTLEAMNATVRYYEVAGRDVTTINRAITRQRPRNAAGRPIPASTDWSVRTDFKRSTVGGTCRITAARAELAATADLPRLLNEAELDRDLRQRWRAYVGELEQMSAQTLLFVRQNLPAIEAAVASASCAEAKAVAVAAVERLRQRSALLEAEREKRLAKTAGSLAEFAPRAARAQPGLCKDLAATGSRLRTFRICLPKREWERMNAEGEAFTKEVQNKSISGRVF